MPIKKRKALIVASNGLGNSGVPRVIVNTIEALHNDFYFDVIVFNNDDYYYEEIKKYQVNIIKIDLKDRKTILSKICWHLFIKNKYIHNNIKVLFENNHYSIIHSFREDDSYPFFNVARAYGVPKRIWHQNTITTAPSTLLKLLKYRNSKITSRYTTDYVGVSKVCCDKTFSKKRYEIIYNTYDDLKYNNLIPNHLERDQLVLTHVATFSSNKNQLFSLDVLSNLLKKHKNSKLILLGKENETNYLNKIKDKIKELELENNVEFFYPDSNIPDVYKQTSFSILPSINEGASLVTIESQASGIKMFSSTSVSEEMDCGGLVRLDLEMGPIKWAESIYKEFNQNPNARNIYNVEKFSKNNFNRKIREIYIK